PLARALAHTAEHGLAAVSLGDIVDEFHDDDGLADARAAEESDLAALDEWRNQIDDLDAGLEELRLGLEVHEARTRAVNRPARRIGGNGRTIVHRLAEHVENAPQRRFAHWHRNRRSGIHHGHATLDAVRSRHGDGAHLIAPDVLLHLGHQVDAPAARGILIHGERVVDLREMFRRELHVEHRANDLDDLADILGNHEMILNW